MNVNDYIQSQKVRGYIAARPQWSQHDRVKNLITAMFDVTGLLLDEYREPTIIGRDNEVTEARRMFYVACIQLFGEHMARIVVARNLIRFQFTAWKRPVSQAKLKALMSRYDHYDSGRMFEDWNVRVMSNIGALAA